MTQQELDFCPYMNRPVSLTAAHTLMMAVNKTCPDNTCDLDLLAKSGRVILHHLKQVSNQLSPDLPLLHIQLSNL